MHELGIKQMEWNIAKYITRCIYMSNSYSMGDSGFLIGYHDRQRPEGFRIKKPSIPNCITNLYPVVHMLLLELFSVKV